MRTTVNGGDNTTPYALAPVYERSPSRQNHRPNTTAAIAATKMVDTPSASRRPETACAGTVTATPMGTRLDIAKRNQKRIDVDRKPRGVGEGLVDHEEVLDAHEPECQRAEHEQQHVDE